MSAQKKALKKKLNGNKVDLILNDLFPFTYGKLSIAG
jgi:hypothetical protein